MRQEFGNFVDPEDAREHLIIDYSSTCLPLEQRWRNNSLTADFLAEYWATFFPLHQTMSSQQQFEIKVAISYIANELLENLTKFSYRPADYPVRLDAYLFTDEFRFYTCNAIDPQAMAAFQARLQELLQGDPQALYLQQVERSAQSGAKSMSQLGLLVMMNDYKASLAWRFETDAGQPNLVLLTTLARLGLS